MSAFVPPTPPPPGDVRHRSIAELEKLVIDPGAYELGSQAWLARALLSPLWTLGVPDLRLLLMHGRGLAWLVPEALDRLRVDPWAPGDYGPGELLLGLCLVEDAYWQVDPQERERLLAVLDDAEQRLGELPDEAARAHWREELAAARERFAAGRTPDDS
jgi:hypothetical protein